jgi:hypothetical protein
MAKSKKPKENRSKLKKKIQKQRDLKLVSSKSKPDVEMPE